MREYKVSLSDFTARVAHVARSCSFIEGECDPYVPPLVMMSCA
jgi:hypothetical protein